MAAVSLSRLTAKLACPSFTPKFVTEVVIITPVLLKFEHDDVMSCVYVKRQKIILAAQTYN